MVSEIRELSEEERGLATEFSTKIGDDGRDLVALAEEKGFRVICKEGERDYLPILMPSGEVLNWDFNPRSLDELGDKRPELDLRDAACYLGSVCSAYLEEQGVSNP